MSTTFTGYVAFGYKIHTSDPAEIKRWEDHAEWWGRDIEIVEPAGPAAGNGEFYAVSGKIELWNSNGDDGPDVVQLRTGRGTGSTTLLDFMADAEEHGLEGGWFDEDEYPDWVYWLEVR